MISQLSALRFGKIQRVSFKLASPIHYPNTGKDQIRRDTIQRAALKQVANEKRGVPIFPEWTPGKQDYYLVTNNQESGDTQATDLTQSLNDWLKEYDVEPREGVFALEPASHGRELVDLFMSTQVQNLIPKTKPMDNLSIEMSQDDVNAIKSERTRLAQMDVLARY